MGPWTLCGTGRHARSSQGHASSCRAAWRVLRSIERMSFFEQFPPPPPPSARQWQAPAWDRPSEGTLPAVVPVGETLIRGDSAVVELDVLRVYPNGFTINLFIVTNPQLEHTRPGFGMFGGPGAEGM